jgi:uncharacterized SAM-binding protein YcdF (DUF218 family)
MRAGQEAPTLTFCFLAMFLRVSMVVLVPGYGGRIRAVERWRMAIALRTLLSNEGGTLVASGYQGEAERLAQLAPHHHVIVEPTAQSTWENVERSIPYFEEAHRLAIASDWFHARRAGRYLQQMRPDLSALLVPADQQWWRGWWIQAGGAAYEALLATRQLVRSAR